MISSGTIPAKVTLSKNFVSDQTNAEFIESPSTSGAFDVSKGFGIATNTSVGVLMFAGGWADQRVTAVMRADNTTDRMGVMARVTNWETSPGAEMYYYANVDNGQAKLQKYVGGAALANMVSAETFTFATGTDITIELSCVGALITAVFTSSGVGGSPLTMTAAEDASIPRRGLMGWRTLTKPGWLRSITVTQV